MPEKPYSRTSWYSKGWTDGLVLAFTLLALLAALAFKFFNGFNPHDDEGFVLITIQQYLSGLQIYEEFFTLFGPFFFIFRQLLSVVMGPDVTHDAYRASSTFICWLIVLVNTAGAWRISKNLFLSATAALLTFLCVSPFSTEPSHPQELNALLIATVGLLVVFQRGAPTNWGTVALGAIAGCVLLTKINVGVFLALPLSLMFLPIPSERLSRYGYGLVGLCVIGPFVLTFKTFDAVFVADLVGIVVLSLFPLGLLLVENGVSPSPRRFVYFVGAIAVSSMSIVAYQLAIGSDFNALMHGILFQSMDLGVKFSIPTPIIPVAHIVAALSLCAFVGWRSGKLSTKGGSYFELGSKVAGALFIGGMSLSLSGMAPLFVAISWLPLLWLIAAAGNEHRREFSVLSAVMIYEVLQVYPVAGRQLNCALVLVPILIVFAAKQQCSSSWLQQVSRSILVKVAICLVPAFVCLSYLRAYESNVSLDLPGAQLLKVSQGQKATYQELVSELESYDTFVTMPGHFSLYLWSKKPTPSNYCMGPWMSVFNDDLQNQILKSLEGKTHAAIIHNESNEFWSSKTTAAGGPLVRHIQDTLSPIKTIDGYEVKAP